MKIMQGPMQGVTDAAMRHWMHELYGGVDEWCTPFVRAEKGEPRRHDMRDVTSPLNVNHDPTAQIIFKDIEEMRLLTDALREQGCRRIDINMGCPFPPQVHKGRGAGVMANLELIKAMGEEIERMGDVEFSVKMRLGIESNDLWREVMPLLNGMPLRHVTVHARNARQQYGGEMDLVAMEEILAESKHPVIYNGSITTPADIDHIVERLPGIAGVMIARGLMARPSLAIEWKQGREWSSEERLGGILRLHNTLLREAEGRLCGEKQVLARMLPLWEYWKEELPKKAAKAILKSSSMSKYVAAVSAVR